MTVAAPNDARHTKKLMAEPAKTKGSARDRFVEQSESWIKKIAAELPEEYVQYAVAERPAPDYLLEEVSKLTSGDQIHKALLLRYVRVVEQMVRKMPSDLISSCGRALLVLPTAT